MSEGSRPLGVTLIHVPGAHVFAAMQGSGGNAPVPPLPPVALAPVPPDVVPPLFDAPPVFGPPPVAVTPAPPPEPPPALAPLPPDPPVLCELLLSELHALRPINVPANVTKNNERLTKQ